MSAEEKEAKAETAPKSKNPLDKIKKMNAAMGNNPMMGIIPKGMVFTKPSEVKKEEKEAQERLKAEQ